LADEGVSPPKNVVRQQINAAIVSASYLLANKYQAKNHVAILEGWLLLLGYILAAAEKNALDEEYWIPSAELIEQIIGEAVGDLISEMQERVHYAQPATVPYADAFVYKDRVTIVAGYLTTYCTYRHIKGCSSAMDDGYVSSQVSAIVEKLAGLSLLGLRGEGQVPLLVNIAVFHWLSGRTDLASDLLLACVDAILLMRERGGLYDPYVDLQDIIRTELSLTLTPVQRNMGSNSYVLRGLVMLLAHMGMREALAGRWRRITHVCSQEFKPAPVWRGLLWRSRTGHQEGRFPEQTQSWQELVRLARSVDVEVVPRLLQARPFYIPLFLALYPHRMSSYWVRSLIASLPGPATLVAESSAGDS